MEHNTLTLQIGKLRPRDGFTEKGGCAAPRLEAWLPLRGASATQTSSRGLVGRVFRALDLGGWLAVRVSRGQLTSGWKAPARAHWSRRGQGCDPEALVGLEAESVVLLGFISLPGETAGKG